MTIPSHPPFEHAIGGAAAQPPRLDHATDPEEQSRSRDNGSNAPDVVSGAHVSAVRNAALDCVVTAALFAGGVSIVFTGALLDAFVTQAQAAERVAPLAGSDAAIIGLFALGLVGAAAPIFLSVSVLFEILEPDLLEEPHARANSFEFSDLFNAVDAGIAHECESYAYRAAIRDGMSDAGRAALNR
jgi:hypothetical protein